MEHVSDHLYCTTAELGARAQPFPGTGGGGAGGAPSSGGAPRPGEAGGAPQAPLPHGSPATGRRRPGRTWEAHTASVYPAEPRLRAVTAPATGGSERVRGEMLEKRMLKQLRSVTSLCYYSVGLGNSVLTAQRNPAAPNGAVLRGPRPSSSAGGAALRGLPRCALRQPCSCCGPGCAAALRLHRR